MIPKKPGIYQMLGKGNEVLYVGKAKNLHKRVASYFRKNLELKVQALMQHVIDIKFIITANETEALLLENNLIKDLKPKYNILYKDDKSYPYLFISKDEFPRISIHRGPKKIAGHYYGPYPNARAANEVLVTLEKIFRLRRCSNTFFQNRSRACLQYQIKRCSAPCVKYIDNKTYQENANLAEKFLKGQSKEIINEIAKKMQSASENLQYEDAINYRNQIESLQNISQQQHITRGSDDIDIIAIVQHLDLFCIQMLFVREGKIIGSRVYFPVKSQLGAKEEALSAFLNQYYIGNMNERPIPKRIMTNIKLSDRSLLEEILQQELLCKIKISTPLKGNGRHWINMAQTNAREALMQHLIAKSAIFKGLVELKEIFKLDKIPEKLECFDVSHMMGEATVASCVAFNQAGPDKANYRLYNITGIAKSDDYAALEQALTRHYRTHVIPDLVIIDGGKGQIARAQKVLDAKAAIILAIAKGKSRKPGLETIYATTAKGTVSLDRFSNALKVLQQIRDEAHRFAITTHRKQFKKRLIK